MCPSGFTRKYPSPQPFVLYSFSASLTVQLGGAAAVVAMVGLRGKVEAKNVISSALAVGARARRRHAAADPPQ